MRRDRFIVTTRRIVATAELSRGLRGRARHPRQQVEQSGPLRVGRRTQFDVPAHRPVPSKNSTGSGRSAARAMSSFTWAPYGETTNDSPFTRLGYNCRAGLAVWFLIVAVGGALSR